MNRAIAALHGTFGRACVYAQSRSMATHAHREAHLIFHLGGQVPKLEVAGNVFVVDAEKAVAVNAFEPHNITYQEEREECLLLLLYIDPKWFLEVASPGDGTLRFGTSDLVVNRAVQRLVETLGSLLFEGDRCDRFDNFLYELTRECYLQSWRRSPTSQVSVAACHALRDHRVRRAIHLMQGSVGMDWSIDNIACRVGLSRPHFFKLFRENVGITPNVYLNTFRTEQAIRRLVNSRAAVTSIGLDLGFASQASFTRFFSANVGIPPTDYRRVAHVA